MSGENDLFNAVFFAFDFYNLRGHFTGQPLEEYCAEGIDCSKEEHIKIRFCQDLKLLRNCLLFSYVSLKGCHKNVSVRTSRILNVIFENGSDGT